MLDNINLRTELLVPLFSNRAKNCDKLSFLERVCFLSITCILQDNRLRLGDQ